MLQSAHYLLALVFSQSYFPVYLISVIERTWLTQDFMCSPTRGASAVGFMKESVAHKQRKEGSSQGSVCLRPLGSTLITLS